MRDEDLFDDPLVLDTLDGVIGLRQRGRAELFRLTEIEGDKFEPVPLTGPVQKLGLLRRRQTGGEFFQDLGPCAYVVRLDDGAIVPRVCNLDALDDQELMRFTAGLAELQLTVAEEHLRRAREAHV